MTSIQSAGSFCGRTVEVLKANTSALIATAQSIALPALNFISSVFQQQFTAVSNVISTKVRASLALRAAGGSRGLAVVAAASGGHLPIVQALLANGATISDEDRIRAIQETRLDCRDILELLANTDELRTRFLGRP